MIDNNISLMLSCNPLGNGKSYAKSTVKNSGFIRPIKAIKESVQFLMSHISI